MIGAPPTFYDTDLEPQPPTHAYSDWASNYTQPQLALTTSPSYHHHSTIDPHPDTQAHPPTQHRDRYQFVNQAPPPSTSPDATQFPYFPSFVDSSNSLSQAMRPQGWSPPQTSAYSQRSATHFDLMSRQYPPTYDPPKNQPRHPSQPADQVLGLAITPAPDRVTPASVSNALPSPGSSHTAHSDRPRSSYTKRGTRSTESRPGRKRQKSESDDGDGDDVLSAGIDMNDKHRQNVIAWDRLQSSVRSAPVRSPSDPNAFQLDTPGGKDGSQSDESDEEHASQRQVQARPASSGSGDAPLSPNTLVESDFDPYPVNAVRQILDSLFGSVKMKVPDAPVERPEIIDHGRKI